MVNEIRSIMNTARRNVAKQVNRELIVAYWNIGRVIVEHEQASNERAEYGKESMRQLYIHYPIFQSVTGKLTWTHYCELLSISDRDKRSFYEKECERSGWSVRELKRQISTSLFERLLLSEGKTNKEKVLELAEKGQIIESPEDIVKDPYVFEFLGLPDKKPMMESELEKALVKQIEDFLLELGRGFMFVGTQQRVTLNNTHYYVDMVFYNKELHAYVLIELKTAKLMPEAVGQLNMYLEGRRYISH